MSVGNVCCQCAERERECQKTCPLDPPAISYDKEKFHMVVDASAPLECSVRTRARRARRASIRSAPITACCAIIVKTDGQRKPACVEVCPNRVLEYMARQFPQHLERVHTDQKAEYLSKRLYPLPKDRIQIPPEERIIN